MRNLFSVLLKFYVWNGINDTIYNTPNWKLNPVINTMFLSITFPLALDETSLPECNSLLVINHCLNNPHSLICLSIRSPRCEPAFHCFTLMTRTEHNSGIPRECCGLRRHMYDLSIKFLDESSFGADQSSVNRLKRWDMGYMGVTKVGCG